MTGHIWKNGFHEAELALIASMSTAALTHEDLLVFYAPKHIPLDPADGELLINSTLFYPGFFKGDINSANIIPDEEMLQGHKKTAIRWKNLRNTDKHPDPACLEVLCSENGMCFEGQCICMHGWSGPQCDVDPCENHISIVPSEKYCNQCKVTFKLNPSTLFTPPITSVMISGSFSNWSAIKMELDDYDQDKEDRGYSKLYPESSFYNGFSSSRSYSVDIHIPNGQNHTYKYFLDQAHWSFDQCNPDAISDGMETMELNSLIHVSCPSETRTCKFVDEGQKKESVPELNRSDVKDTVDDIDSGSVVQLFEWTYNSVARECKKLGEEGWAAVQLSPVNSHLVLSPNIIKSFNIGDSPLPPLYSWRQRYEPASYNLNSRSGTEKELRATTAECARMVCKCGLKLY